MFGTLVVSLPSKHEGGDVLVTFNGQKKILRTATASEWSTTYLAWYADVLHEVRPVEAGYRIVLTFNLVQSGPVARHNLANQDAMDANLRSTMLQCDSSDDYPYLIYLLEHKYTDANLSIDRMKGHDANKLQRITNLAREYDFLYYLASVEKQVSGGAAEESEEERYEEEESGEEESEDDEPRHEGSGEFFGVHDILDAHEDKIELKRVVNLDGEVVLKDVPVVESDFVQTSPFKRRPDNVGRITKTTKATLETRVHSPHTGIGTQ